MDDGAAAALEPFESLKRLAADAGLDPAAKSKLITHLTQRVLGDSEASRGAILFSEGSGGIELLAGGSRYLAARAAKHRGYTIVAWVRESVRGPKFELATVCGTLKLALEPLTNDPQNGVRWRCEVWRGQGAKRGPPLVGVARVGEYVAPIPGCALAPEWRCIVVSHAARYLTAAEVAVSINGQNVVFDDGAICVTAALPTAEDADAWGGDDRGDGGVFAARAVLRPPALTVLRGFDGVAGSVALYDGAMTEASVAMLLELGPRAPAGMVRRVRPDRGQAWAALAAHGAVVALEPFKTHAAVASAPRGLTFDIDHIQTGIVVRPTCLEVVLLHGVTWECGSAARARDAMVALGGVPVFVSAAVTCEETAVDALKCVAVALRCCGPENVDFAADRGAMEILGARLRNFCCKRGEAFTDDFIAAAHGVVDSSYSHGGTLAAAAVRSLWADDALWAPAPAGARAKMMVKIAERAGEATFAAAFRELGVARLARAADRAIADAPVDARFAEALRTIAAATLRAELADEDEDAAVDDGKGAAADDADDDDRAALLLALGAAALGASGEAGEDRAPSALQRGLPGVDAVLDALVSNAGDAVKTALCGALSEAAEACPEAQRAAVAALLRERRFAETTAMAIVGAGALEATPEHAGRVEAPASPPAANGPPAAAASSALRSAVLRLALWGYSAAEQALRRAIAVAAQVDEERDARDVRVLRCKKAQSTFRAAALRSVAALATAAASALDSGAWDLDAPQLIDALGLGQTDMNTADNALPLWLSLPFVAAIASRAPAPVLEATVATMCVTIKSDESALRTVAELEPWYMVGALLRLARTSGYGDTVELLALDALASLVLRRAVDGPALELDARAVEAVARTLGAGGLWEKRAFSAVAAALVRRLGADVPRHELEACRALAKLLALVLEVVWPPPPAEAAAAAPRIRDARASALALATVEVAAALRSAALERREFEEVAARHRLQQQQRVNSVMGAQTPFAAARAIGGLFNQAATTLQQAADDEAAQPARAAVGEASLLALRRCARALAHALHWAAADDAGVAARIAEELRACVKLCVELADDRVAKGFTAAAIVACDDVLHALACVRCCRDARKAQGNEDVVAVCDEAVLGVIKDAAASAHAGGVAAACCRAALLPAAHAANAEDALRKLSQQLDAALEADRGDLNDMLLLAAASSPEHFDELGAVHGWLEPQGEPGSHLKRAANARRNVLQAAGRVAAQRNDAEALEQRLRTIVDAAAAAAREDVDVEIGTRVGASSGGDDDMLLESGSQKTWEVLEDAGDLLACPSVVLKRATDVRVPLMAHTTEEHAPERAPIPQPDDDGADRPVVFRGFGAADDGAAAGDAPIDVTQAAFQLEDDEARMAIGGKLAKELSKVFDVKTISEDDASRCSDEFAAAGGLNAESPRPPPLPSRPPAKVDQGDVDMGCFEEAFPKADDEEEEEEEEEEDEEEEGFHEEPTPAPDVAAPVLRGFNTQKFDDEAQQREEASSAARTEACEKLAADKAAAAEGPARAVREVTDAVYEVRHCTRIRAEDCVSGTVWLHRNRLRFGQDVHDKTNLFSRRLGECRAVLLRRYKLRDTAIEAYFKRGAIFIDCFDEALGAPASNARRDDLARKLGALVRAQAHGFGSANGEGSGAGGSPASLLGGGGFLPLIQVPGRSLTPLLSRCTRAWQERRLDNFGYLCVVNALAGRSFNDTCAYPVFPWVVADYVSPVLDLSNPDMFRDLSKPMGALNEARLRETVARYDSFDDVHMPKFHYGSHYSTAAGVVVHYLLRLAPRFAKLHCELQSGRFDVADRLFTCIAEAWNSNSGDRGDKSGGEVKELTPEFFSTPAFLVNRGRLPLGTSQDGRAVGDVELPPWAHGSAETFIQRHRAALESDHVSAHLHLWVDLVFGYKQRGRNAVEARNVFFYLCYADTVDVEAIEDEGLRAATVLQASHFGQCPAQLLRTKPHAPRGAPPAHLPRPLRVPARGAAGPAPPPRPAPALVAASAAGTAVLAGAWVGCDAGAGALASAAGPDSSAVSRCVSLLGAFRAAGVVALRATHGRCVCVDAAGAVAVLAWSYDAVVTDESQVVDYDESNPNNPPSLAAAGDGALSPPIKRRPDKRRVASLRPLTAGDDTEDRARRPATQLGAHLSQSLVDISADGSIIACVDEDDPRALRIVELDVGDMRATTATAIGEASVVAHHAALTLVRCVEPRGAYGDILESVLVLVGAADGTASTWSLRRNSKGRWHRRANSSSLGRRPGVVFRGHGGSAVVAGDVNLALDVCVLAWQDGAVAVYSLGDGRLLRRLAVGGDEPRHVAISRQGVVVVGRLKPRSASSPAGGGGIVGATTLLEAHSVNGGVLARATVACDVKRLRVVGELSDAVLLVGAAAVELRALATLAPLRVLRLPIDSTLVDVDLAPDAQHPAALFVATSSGDVALRVLAGCEAWADRRAASDAGVGAFFTKRTSLAIGFAAAALGRGRDLATATSDVVGEARAFSKRGSAAASKPNVFSKAIGRLFAAQPQPPAPR